MRRETSAGRMFHFIAAVTVIILDLWVIAGLSQFKGRSIFSFLNWIIWIMMDWQAKCCLMWFSEATKSKPEPPAPAECCFSFSAGWLQTSAAFICFCFVCFLFVFFSRWCCSSPENEAKHPFQISLQSLHGFIMFSTAAELFSRTPLGVLVVSFTAQQKSDCRRRLSSALRRETDLR